MPLGVPLLALFENAIRCPTERDLDKPCSETAADGWAFLRRADVRPGPTSAADEPAAGAADRGLPVRTATRWPHAAPRRRSTRRARRPAAPGLVVVLLVIVALVAGAVRRRPLRRRTAITTAPVGGADAVGCACVPSGQPSRGDAAGNARVAGTDLPPAGVGSSPNRLLPVVQPPRRDRGLHVRRAHAAGPADHLRPVPADPLRHPRPRHSPRRRPDHPRVDRRRQRGHRARVRGRRQPARRHRPRRPPRLPARPLRAALGAGAHRLDESAGDPGPPRGHDRYGRLPVGHHQRRQRLRKPPTSRAAWTSTHRNSGRSRATRAPPASVRCRTRAGPRRRARPRAGQAPADVPGEPDFCARLPGRRPSGLALLGAGPCTPML